jgi:hypothetical protein
MKYLFSILAIAVLFHPLRAAAFELKNPQREKPRLKIELEAAPSRLQQDFDKYVEDLAESARRDAESPPEKRDTIKELQAKAVNPYTLFRW